MRLGPYLGSPVSCKTIGLVKAAKHTSEIIKFSPKNLTATLFTLHKAFVNVTGWHLTLYNILKLKMLNHKVVL